MSPDQLTGTDSSGPVAFSKPRTGLVTLLFTDIVSSTALKQRLGDKAGALLIQQQRASFAFKVSGFVYSNGS
jgi:class 3 adenylate cyclase